jgi:hypothetical protein
MPEELNGSNSPSRLDRIEKIVEVLANTQADLQQDVKILLRSQVVMSDSFERLTAKVTELAEAQRHTEERLNDLIKIVDGIVRRQPPSA